ncbi:hypothetical protein ACFSQ7_22785 [Paenibacillus rhizoplanae]
MRTQKAAGTQWFRRQRQTRPRSGFCCCTAKDRPLRAESFQDSESAPLHEKSRLHYPGVMQQTCTRKKPPEPIRFPAALEGIIELTCEAGD